MKTMEIRKVQLTGGSSFVLTLPKDWIKSLNIKKNDPLGLMVQPDGTLIVTARTSQESVQMSKSIPIDDIDDPKHLFRMLIGAYVMGYTTIEIRSKVMIEQPMRATVIDFTQTAIGPEIIEESSKDIIIKDLLSPTEMPFDKTVKRMSLLARSMHEDAVRALRERDETLAKAVIERDRELDRLHWLVARQSNVVLRDVTLAKKMGVSMEESSYYFLVSRIIERIGDHAVHIARALPGLSSKKLDSKAYERIYSASQVSLSLFKNSVDAWFRKDISAANDVLNSIDPLTEQCQQILSDAMRTSGPSAISLSYIAESIRRTGEYSGNLSELVINNLMRS
jgi:phosphate uptake regulator